MNLMQQMYFAFATSFKTNNFFCFVYETHNTHTQNQNQETNNKHNNADEVNKEKKRASAVLLFHQLSFQISP